MDLDLESSLGHVAVGSDPVAGGDDPSERLTTSAPTSRPQVLWVASPQGTSQIVTLSAAPDIEFEFVRRD